MSKPNEYKPIFQLRIPALAKDDYYSAYPDSIKTLKREIRFFLEHDYWDTNQAIILTSFGVWDKGRRYLERHNANKAVIVLSGNKIVMRFIKREVNSNLTVLSESVVEEKILLTT